MVGVDPARGGGDKTRIIDRQGRRLVGRVDFVMDTDDTMVVDGEVERVIQHVKPKAVFIDVTGLGAGVYDRLRELKYEDIVFGVNFAQKASRADKFANKRAEIWDELREWLDDPAGADIPDDDILHSELCALIWGKGATRFDSSGRLLLEAKEHIKERLGFSPDGGDAAALTFTFPVGAFDDMHWGGTYDQWSNDVYDRDPISGY